MLENFPERISLPGEEWRISPSLPEYMVSSLGRVVCIPYKAPVVNGGERWYGGHPHYGTCSKRKDGSPRRRHFRFRGKNYKVSRLVCEAFNGPPPFPGAYVLHVDENNQNNVPTNLVWGTQKENLNAPGFIEYCKSRTGNNNPYIKGRKNK